MKLLRKPVLTLVIFAIAAAILASAAAAGQKEPPKFYVQDLQPNLGTYYEGQDIEYQFTIRNHGAGELHILGVRPG